MVNSALKQCHIVAIGQWKSDWPQSKVKKWVEECGGKISFQPKLTAQTTHVVLQESTWKEQGDFVKKVVAAKEDDDRDIHIVDYNWLDHSLTNRSKRRESPYSFEKKQKDADDAARKADKERAKLQKALEPRSGSGLMAQVFTESTDPFISDIGKARAQRAKTEAARVREEAKTENKMLADKLREHKNIKALAAIFQRGVSKARNELLSENHHVYMDQTSFHYDVLLTKIAYKNNRNQRYALTIYESNTVPHTYAFNCQYSGTNIPAQNNIIATLGSNFQTAFGAFKKVFLEKTKGRWEDRVKDAKVRYDREKRLDAGPEQMKLDDDAPFAYHPPLYGPRGGDLMTPPMDVTPEAKPPPTIEEVSDAVSRATSEENEEGEAYMSGANGDGAVSPPREPSPQQPVLPEPATGEGGNDAFQQLLDGPANVSENFDFLDTAFDEPFPFGETTFDEQTMNGVVPGQDIVTETQTQPSSQLPDTQDLGYSSGAQDFGNMQPSSQMPDTQEFGQTQVAEQGQTDLLGFVDAQDQAKHDQASNSDRKLLGEGSPEAQTSARAAVAEGDEPLEPSTSVLGKRKDSQDEAANKEEASAKKVANGDGIKGEESPLIVEKYPLSPKSWTEPTPAPRVRESEPMLEEESQSQVDQGRGSGYVDFGLDGTQAT